MVRQQRSSFLLLLAIGSVVLSACGNGGVDTSGPIGVTTSAAASSTPTVDPQVQAALDAYAAYGSTYTEAERKPVPPGTPYPPEADFTRFTFDPLQVELKRYITGMALSDSVATGVPPRSHVRVKSVKLDVTADRPWPTVMLVDCLSGIDGWVEIDTKTGKPLPVTKQKVPPPFSTTIEVIYYQNHWGVRDVTPDLSRTCTP